MYYIETCRYSAGAYFTYILQEELEEGGQTSIYDNYKFLTKEDLEKLNLTNLIGTNLLRAYMHGFFIDYRLYKKVRLMFFLIFFVKDIMQFKNSGYKIALYHLLEICVVGCVKHENIEKHIKVKLQKAQMRS